MCENVIASPALVISKARYLYCIQIFPMPLHFYIGYDVHNELYDHVVYVKDVLHVMLNNCAVGVFELKSLDLLPGPTP